MGEPLERGRRDDDGRAHGCAEDGRRRAHLADVDEHARAQLPARPGRHVVGQRALVARAAREVAVGALVEALGGERLPVGDVERRHEGVHGAIIAA